MLKEMRKSKFLTQGQLAEKLKISKPYYAQIETGFLIPGINVINKLARFFRMTPCKMNEILKQNYKGRE